MPKYYPIPEYSKREVNRAGDVFLDLQSTEEQKDAALAVINNWRASHNFPLNTFQMRLRKIAKKINPRSLVAQRIKRLASIRFKLERFAGMNMAQIQDIGGCRAIMKNVHQVDDLVHTYKHDSRGIKHKLHKEQDYILNPKPDGYRGVHLIYKYKSDKSSKYDDMRIEIQLRTELQHAWATAVETVGTFIGQPLKSGQGNSEWLRFFALMSSSMAISEGKPIVPGTPDDYSKLRKEIISLNKKLDIEARLTTFKKSLEILGGERRRSGTKYYLLELDSANKRVIIRAYGQKQITTSSADYFTLERRIRDNNRDAVLVSADSIEALKLAYPNYYLDTDLFLKELAIITESETRQLRMF